MLNRVERRFLFMTRISYFDTLEQLDVLSAPFRVQILDVFARPSTVKEAADRLAVPVTRLYYHVNLLLDHGFLEVVEEREVGSLVERKFAVTADSFRPSEQFLDRYGAEGRLEGIKLLFRSAEAGIESAAANGLLDVIDGERSTLSFSQFRLTPERRREFVSKLNELLTEYSDREGEPMWSLVAVLPRWTPGR